MALPRVRPVIAPCLTKSVWQFVFDDPPGLLAARGIADGKRYFHDRPPGLFAILRRVKFVFPPTVQLFPGGGGGIVSDGVLNFSNEVESFGRRFDGSMRCRFFLPSTFD